MENDSSSNNTSPHGVLLQNCRVGPDWPQGVCIFANLCGLTSTCIWFIVLFPQIWKNWRRKSVQGLSVLWATANFTASLVNLFYVFIFNKLPWYTKVDAVYMPTLELILLIQFLVFGSHRMRIKLLYGGLCLVLWSIIISVELLVTDAYKNVQWLAIILWCIETFPQVMLNMKLHSTHGQSTTSVVISLIGKATDFLSTYLLVIPLQFVIMAYFSSTMAYINGLQVAWYVKSPAVQTASDCNDNGHRNTNTTTQNTNEQFVEDTSVGEPAEDTDTLLETVSDRPDPKPTLAPLKALSRVITLGFITVVLFGYIIGLLWNTHSFLAFLAPGGIVIILGCTYTYYNWQTNFRRRDTVS